MITSRQNPLYKDIKLLQKRRERESRRQFIVEGKREISRVQKTDIVKLVVSNGIDWNDVDCEVIEMAPELIEELTYRGGDAIAIVKMKKENLKNVNLIVVAAGVEKPGNLGAIMRTADGAGFDTVVTLEDGVDIYSPNVIRASLGAFFTRQVFQSNTDELIAYCKQNSIQLFAASPEAKQSLYETKFPQKACIVIGSEAFGISDQLKAASKLISLPMNGEIDSLNASTAFGVIAYEVVRQRSFV